MSKASPPGWFNLTERQYADLGAMTYLAALTGTHAERTLPQALYAFEPALRTDQYCIYRNDGFPRAFVTFAGLSLEAERRYAVENKPLRPEDWSSGSSFWIVDLVAPFGHTAQIVEQLKRDIPHERVRTNRIVGDLQTPRIVEWRRDAASKIGLKFYRSSDFADMIDKASA